MELIEVILSKENLNRAYKKVVSNKGVSVELYEAAFVGLFGSDFTG